MKLTISDDQMTATAEDGTELRFEQYSELHRGTSCCDACYCAAGAAICEDDLDSHLCMNCNRADHLGGRWLKKGTTK